MLLNKRKQKNMHIVVNGTVVPLIHGCPQTTSLFFPLEIPSVNCSYCKGFAVVTE